MFSQDGKRFRLSLCGYNRATVDAEFERLIERSEALDEERQTLQSQIDTLNVERVNYGREQVQLNSTITAMTGQVVELENNLARAKNENDTLTHAIEAHKAEKNAMQLRYDQLRERDRDFSLREREFAELQSSVSSIMSVTKRATDRLFQKVIENQERVTQIAGDAAREVAAIRSDMANVRQQLNETLDEVQDRIDRVDASLTGAVHKLVAIKHDDGLQMGDNQSDILSEVERLLSMKAGEVDYSDGKGYSVPVLGPYSAKFLTDTAQRVSEGKILPKHPQENGAIEVRKVNPTPFESTDSSILEATRLLNRGGMTPDEYYASSVGASAPVQSPVSVSAPVQHPIQIGFSPSPEGTATAQASVEAAMLSDFTAASSNLGQYQVGTYNFTPYVNKAPDVVAAPSAPIEPEVVIACDAAAKQVSYVKPTAKTSTVSCKVSVRARRNKK